MAHLVLSYNHSLIYIDRVPHLLQSKTDHHLIYQPMICYRLRKDQTLMYNQLRQWYKGGPINMVFNWIKSQDVSFDQAN